MVRPAVKSRTPRAGNVSLASGKQGEKRKKKKEKEKKRRKKEKGVGTRCGGKLTVKLNDIVPDALAQGPVGLLGGDDALLLGLAQVELEDEEQGRSDDREDDGEAAEAPAPADVFVKVLGGLGPGEGGDHVGGRGEGEGQAAVLQLGDVGGDDVDAVRHAAEAERVEDVGGAEGGQVVAGRHEHQAERGEDGHDQEALGTAPDVQDLGHGDEDGGRHGAGDDVDDVQQRVGLEVARDEGEQAREDGALERIDEVDEPDAAGTTAG